MTDYRTIADTVAAEIAAGTIRPGSRLPPQRDFAYRNGIAVSTAARVYAELTRRGLVGGEVGRGTFVRSAMDSYDQPAEIDAAGTVNLEMVVPVLPDQRALMAAGLVNLADPGVFAAAMRAVGPRGTAEARRAAARLLSRGSWTPNPEQILFTGNGRQALAAALSALAAPGVRVGIEAFSYPVAKSIAARLGVVLVPIALDEDGIRPDAIVQAHRDHGLKGVYIQPALHNPLGITMGPERRAAIAATLVGQQLIAIEDAVYSFLVEDPPLAALAPDHVILIDSLSKRLAPGTTLGFAVAPGELVERVARAIRAGGWNAQGLAFVAAIGWLENGTAVAVAAGKH